MKRKRKDFEIRFYERLLEKRPDFIQVLTSLGNAYTHRGFYREGLDIDRRLVNLRPQDPIGHYNLACSLSLLGDIDKAFGELKKSVLLGYDDFPHIIKDPDLKNLRKHPNFKTFIKKASRLSP